MPSCQPEPQPETLYQLGKGAHIVYKTQELRSQELSRVNPRNVKTKWGGKTLKDRKTSSPHSFPGESIISFSDGKMKIRRETAKKNPNKYVLI